MTHKYFCIENGVIVSGPSSITPPQTQPKVRVRGLELHNKTPEQLKDYGYLPQEIVGYEPFNPVTQIRTGPVNTVLSDKVVSAYTVRDKTAQELSDEKETRAVSGLGTVQNKTILDALWEFHKAIRGLTTMPVETKAQYAARLKEMWKANL